MPRLRTATALLLLSVLVLATSCAGILRRSGDEIRRQQVKSKPQATGTDSSKKSKKPTRAIVHKATYDAADGFVDGAIDSFQDPDRKEQLDELGDSLEERIESITEGAGESMVAGVNKKLPETRGAIIEMMEGIGKELGLDPEKNIRKIFGEIAKGVKTEIRPQVHALIEEDILGVFEDKMADALGPKLKDRVRDNIKPALDELTKGIPDLAEQLAESTARGFSAGMAASLDPNKEGSLGAIVKTRADVARETVDKGLEYLLLLALLVAIVVIIVALFKFLRERGERVEAERARAAADQERDERDKMLRLVTAAIQEAGKRDSLQAFRQEIKRMSKDGGDTETAAALNYFLTREGLKLGG